ncbi:MAG: hypothetical protein IJ946_08080 [Clostridia bacterium]|nr:hypothetical protein [Clostridia bacterium]
MGEITVLLIFLFFAVLGVAAFTARLWLFLLRPKKKSVTYTVLRLNEETEENALYVLEKYRWYGKEYADYIILLCNEPNERIKRCLSFYENVICCREENLSRVLKIVMEDEDERSCSANRMP